MYDINQVSELTGVSKVTIYKKIKKLKNLEPFIVHKGDKTYILEDGLRLIKENLTVNKKAKLEVESELAIEDISMDLTINKELINLLTEQLKEKDIQLKEKDKQIAELHKLIENSQILLKEEQKKNDNQIYLEDHFEEVDNKLQDLREKMEQKRSDKKYKKGFFKIFSK
ncbi:hypothetical protein [Clostridium septicum]|uniref:hypothetical protein n=1 Tax=Clostridium septicum TaxID=1504 RepID=UPI000829AC81|nr:hypothetical protein [Clostridium septicum]